MIAVAADLHTDLVVRRHGRDPNEAPTLVLLHGLTDSGAAWHGDSPRFTAELVRALLLEDPAPGRRSTYW